MKVAPRLSTLGALLVAASTASAAALLGCPPDDKKTPVPTAAGACEKVGQSCEFSPGKLGTCVQKDDCKTGSCFVCQSQH